MRGRIKRFIEDKGYGFITGEDGQDYFFHISQVRDMVEIKNYMIVNFDITDGKKGKNAVNIRVSEQNNTSRFVTCGGTNIRLNNIKQYGLGKYPVLYEKVFQEYIVCNVNASFLERLLIGSEEKKYKFEGEWSAYWEISEEDVDRFINDDMTSVCARKSNGELTHDTSLHKKRRDVYKVEYKKYLYITTYQNDNFKSKETEVNFDVVEKYNEINNAMKM